MEWIKTSDRLPEDKGSYLFWIEDKKTAIVLFYDPEWDVLFDPITYDLIYLVRYASHWIEIKTPKND